MEKTTIKKYLYLDENIINSYLSQIYKGSLSNIILIDEEQKSHSNTTSNSNEYISGNLGLNIGVIKGEVNTPSSSYNESLNQSSSITGGQSLTKVYDTYSKIDLFLEKVVTKNESYKPNDIIEIDDKLQLVNFGKIQQLMNDAFFDKKNNANREERRQKKKNNDTKVNSELKEMLDLYLKIIPSNIIFYNDDFIIPIDVNNLLCNPNFISYNFTNDLKVVGEVIGSVDMVNSFDVGGGTLSGLESKLNKSVMDTFQDLFDIDVKKANIIRPISIYTSSRIDLLE